MVSKAHQIISELVQLMDNTSFKEFIEMYREFFALKNVDTHKMIYENMSLHNRKKIVLVAIEKTSRKELLKEFRAAFEVRQEIKNELKKFDKMFKDLASQ